MDQFNNNPQQPQYDPNQQYAQQPQYAQPQQQYDPNQQYAQQQYAQQPYGQQPYGQPQAPAAPKDKLVAGLLGIFLGSLGIHKFYLGYTKAGVIMLLVSLLTFGIGASIMAIIALIEGILYLTKSDEEFANTYVYNEKQWF